MNTPLNFAHPIARGLRAVFMAQDGIARELVTGASSVFSDGGAQVVIAKEALTWKQVVGLTVNTVIDPGVKYTIRAFEVGQIQVPNPDAICLITGV